MKSLHLGIQGDVGYGQPRARYPNSLTGVYPFVPVAKFKPFYQFLLGQKKVSLGVSHFIMFSFKVSVLSLRFPAIGHFFLPGMHPKFDYDDGVLPGLLLNNRNTALKATFGTWELRVHIVTTKGAGI